ncbi:MAG: hypothetical protein P4L84_12705 [Isosphaeraceae bacterium]|nr:hypothetical protein [Isosphaeraceae bacterium]
MGQPLEITEHHRHAVLVRKTRQLFVEHAPEFAPCRVVPGARGFGFAEFALPFALPRPSHPRTLGHAICHAVEPRAQQLALANGARFPHQNQERRLKRVLDIVRVAEQTAADAEHQRPVSGDQRLERHVVAPRDEALQQRGLRQADDSPVAKQSLDLG